jgi:hypothetical protein
MGVDCKIKLPDDVRVSDVAKAIGILAGLPATRWDIGDKGAYAAHVDGCDVKSCDPVPECAVINLPDRQVLYYFEWGSGGRGLMPRSTPFWIAVGARLCQFFGGEMDYDDCDEIACDFSCDKPRLCNCPEYGQEWQDLQDELLAIKPVTKEELKFAERLAAYPDRG